VGWRIFFAVLAIGTLLVALIDALFVRNGPAELGIANFSWDNEPVTANMPLGEVFRSKWIAVAGLGIAACTFAIAGTATWVVPAFITFQHMPPAAGAIIGTVMGLSQVGFLIIGGYMADSLGKLFMIKLSAVLALLTAVMFLTSTVYPMSFGILVLFAALSGLAVLGGGAIFSLVSEKYPIALAPAAVGYAEVFGILSSFVSPWVMGAIINVSGGSFTEAFVAFAIIEGIFLLLLMVLARETAISAGHRGPVSEVQAIVVRIVELRALQRKAQRRAGAHRPGIMIDGSAEVMHERADDFQALSRPDMLRSRTVVADGAFHLGFVVDQFDPNLSAAAALTKSMPRSVADQFGHDHSESPAP
jgi:hypothetical protein